MGSEGLKTRKQERFSCTMRTVLDTVSRLNMNRLLRASLLIRLLAASAQVAAMQPLITDDTATQGLGVASSKLRCAMSEAARPAAILHLCR